MRFCRRQDVSNYPFLSAKLGENAGYSTDKMLVWERLSKGKVEFSSDLISSTITYWLGEQVSGQVGGQVSEQVSEQVQQLINAIRDNVLSLFEIQVKLRLSSRSFVQMKLLKPAIEGGFLLRAYPDKPNHPKQRYYLSEKGLKLVK